MENGGSKACQRGQNAGMKETEREQVVGEKEKAIHQNEDGKTAEKTTRGGRTGGKKVGEQENILRCWKIRGGEKKEKEKDTAQNEGSTHEIGIEIGRKKKMDPKVKKGRKVRKVGEQKKTLLFWVAREAHMSWNKFNKRGETYLHRHRKSAKKSGRISMISVPLS